MFIKLNCCRGSVGSGNGKAGGGHATSDGTGLAKAGGQIGPVRRRWLMLATYAFINMSSAAHWIMYSTITDVIQEHYGVSFLAVNWTAAISMAAYVPLMFPASWIIDKYGLRVALILCSLLMAAGSWIKVFAVQPDSFAIAFAGQVLIGVGNMFALGAPSRLAALWFGAREVSLACALGVFGSHVGVAIGFLIPPLLVPTGGDTAGQLRFLCLIYAAVPTVLFAVTVLFFRERPPRPPSAAQAQAQAHAQAVAEAEVAAGNTSHKTKAFFRSIHTLFAMPNFVLLWASYGLTAGSFYGLSTVLNPLVLSAFPGANREVGSIGLTMVLGAVVGSVVGGLVLDAWHKYKQTTVAAIFLGGVGMAAFMTSLYFTSMPAVYASAAFLGFFTAGYVPVGYEFSAEITYPLPEATVVGLLNAAGELTGIVLSQGGVVLQDKYGNEITTGTFLGVLSVALLLCCFIRSDLKRLAAMRQATEPPTSIALAKTPIDTDLKA